MDAQTWALLLAVFVLGATLAWRYREVQKPRLNNDTCEELAEVVTQTMFAFAGAANEFVPIDPSYWRQDLQLTDSEWIYLCRWMAGRGWTTTPAGWGWTEVLSGTTPRSLALTPRSWNLLIAPPNTPSVWIEGNNSGPINFSGQQFVLADVEISADDLAAIVEALNRDAQRLPPLEASQALAAASSLRRAIEGSLQPQDPEVRGTLEWVKARASEAVGNAAGTALFGATAALLRSSGII